MKSAKKAVSKGKAMIKRAAKSPTGQELINQEKKILGDLLVKLGQSLKKR